MTMDTNLIALLVLMER